MTLFFPLAVFLLQLFLAAWQGMFGELVEGIALSGFFLFFFYASAFLFKCGKKERFFYSSEKISKKDIIRFIIFLLCCAAVFADALRVMPNLEAIRLDQVASTRGDLLEESNFWQPRLLGYLSVGLTIFTIYRSANGLRYNLFAFASIAVSLMNSTLTFGRGYLLLNLFALINLYSSGRSRKNVLPFIALAFLLFIGVEFIRHGDNGFNSLLETLSNYLLAPIVGITHLYRNNVDITLECQSALLSAFSTGCSGNLSQLVVQSEVTGFTSNVYGVPGEWYGIGGLVVIPLVGVVYGISCKKNTTKLPRTWSSSIAYYLFSVFSIYYFFSDPFLTNGVFAALLLLVTISTLRNLLVRKNRNLRLGN